MWESTTMSITLPDGTVVTGTRKQVEAVMRAMGVFVEDGIHYKSEHLGVIKISDMETNHLRNAILKLYRQWLENVSKQSNTEFARMLTEGPRGITLLAMLKEIKAHR